MDKGDSTTTVRSNGLRLPATRPKIRPDPGWGYGSGVGEAVRRRAWKRLKRPTLARWLYGLRLYLYPGNETSRLLFLTGYYEPNQFYALDKILQAGMTFIDVGANMGLYTLFAAKKVGRRGAVLAIEPSSRDFQRLKANVEENALTNVRLLQVAVSDRQTEAELLVAEEEHSGHNTLGAFGYKDVALRGRERVRVERLDDIVQREGLESVDVIKMDIEGAEFLALQGTRKTLTRYRPLLLIELSDTTLKHQGCNSQQVWELLTEIGYSIYAYDDKIGLPVPAQRKDFYDGENVIAVDKLSEGRWPWLALPLTKQQYQNLVKRLQVAEREQATLLEERWSLLQRLSPADAEAFRRSVQSARSSAKPAARQSLARANAAHFDGLDDVLLLGRRTELQFDSGTPFTIEAWVKADQTAQGIVLAYQSNWDDTKASWSIAYGDGSIGAAWTRPATAPGESVSLHISTKTDRRWHHIAVTYDGRGNGSGFRMYYDGLVVGRGDPVALSGAWTYEELYPDRANVDWGAHVGNRTHADAPAGEGEGYVAAGVPFAGKITDVRVWSIARWQEEIQQDGLNHSPLNDSRLILELLGASLEGDAVARWRDTSGHHHDAVQKHQDMPGFWRSAWRPAVSRGNRLGAVQTAVLPGHLVRIE